MISRRANTWPALAAVMALAAGGLCWLLFGLGGDTKGRTLLSDSAGGSIEYLPNSAGLTLTEVASSDRSWQPLPTVGFIPGSDRTGTWLRITLHNTGPKSEHGILENADIHADLARLSTPDNTEPGNWLHLASGESIALAERALWGRCVAFPVTLSPGETRVLYLEMEDHFGIWQEFVWWPNQHAFHTAKLRDALTEGAYFGTLIALLLYNVILWVRLRFPDTGRYLLYLGSFIAYMLLARSMHSLLGWALPSPWLEIFSMMMLAASGAFLAEFARIFLELPTRAPRANLAARIVSAIMAALALASLATAWFDRTNLLYFILLAGTLTHLILLGATVMAWRAGARQARYFILAFGLLFTGFLPILLIWFLPVPLDVAAKALLIGSALEMLLLSVGTADRFSIMQRETIRAQQALLEETAQRQTLQEAYADELEVEVRERTRELAAANTDKDRIIAVLAHDLRSPLTGLTLSAEQLTNVPAHARITQFVGDSARIGRQLLLLIEDLALWVQLRRAIPQVAPHPLRSLITPVIALHHSQAERLLIRLSVSIPEGLFANVDRVLAQTLVRNLLGNAIKFARHEVRVGAERLPDGIRIYIRDDGPGLPGKVLAQLSSPEPAPMSDAGGLGLRLCREISQVIGTTLEVEILATGGTEFSFILPEPSRQP